MNSTHRDRLRAAAGMAFGAMLLVAAVGKASAWDAGSGAAALTPLEGKSLVPAFAGRPIDRREVFWEHEGNRAVRVGDWKLVGKHAGPWELYDLSQDRVEAKDLAAAQPSRVKSLAATYEAWAKRTRVEPWPVPPPKK